MNSDNHVGSDCDVAFKEWGVVCAALAAGRQSIIVRKGGIHEGREGFRVEHPRFWLFPTAFHQQAESLVPSAYDLVAAAEARRPPAGKIRLQLLADVRQVWRVEAEAQLASLESRQILAPKVLAERFRYRQPGLFVLAVEIRSLPEAVELDDSPGFAGCRSWVPLPLAISTSAAAPVLDETVFQARHDALAAALGDRG